MLSFGAQPDQGDEFLQQLIKMLAIKRITVE